jgi:hypothetical protein
LLYDVKRPAAVAAARREACGRSCCSAKTQMQLWGVRRMHGAPMVRGNSGAK